jgi:drug/metabolite transporter (DMT)-like permease
VQKTEPTTEQTTELTKTISGDILVLVAMAMFGTYSLFLRFYPQIPTLVFLLAFQVVGAAALGAHNCLRGHQSVTRKGWLLLIALTGATLGNDLCYFLAFRLTSVANAAVAHQTVSIFLLLLAPLMLSEKTTRAEWLSLWVALLGIAILYSDHLGLNNSHDLIGISLALLSGLLYALLIVLYRKLHHLGLSLSTVNWWRYCFSTVALTPIVLSCEHWLLTHTAVVVLVSFGFLFAVVAASLHIFAMSRTRAMHVSIIGKSEPVFATLYALLFLHEIPSMQAIIGGAFIIGSSIWLAFNSHSQEDV